MEPVHDLYIFYIFQNRNLQSQHKKVIPLLKYCNVDAYVVEICDKCLVYLIIKKNDKVQISV